MQIININEFQIREFKPTIGKDRFKLIDGGKYRVNPDSTAYTLREMVYDVRGSLVSRDFLITEIELECKILKVGDIIRLQEESFIIKGFPLLNDEIVIEFESQPKYKSTVRINTYKNMLKGDTKPVTSKASTSNDYTLADIEKVLSDVLDKPELKEVLKRFKTLKYDMNKDVSAPAKDLLNEATDKMLADIKKKGEYAKYFRSSSYGNPFLDELEW